MSSYFSKLIKAGKQLREFNFKLASINDDSKYIVDVPDDNGHRLQFNSNRNSNGEWKIEAQLLPAWVLDAEAQIAEAIEENRQSEMERKK